MSSHRNPKVFLIILGFILILGFIFLPMIGYSAAEDRTIQGETALPNKSYILREVKSKETLLAENENLRSAPASTTKLLTGLVALDYVSENDLIEVGNEVNAIEGSRLGLKAGDKIFVRDLLTAMYLMSANDAAAALAVGAKGSIPEFARAMNEYAKRLSLDDSNFVNPHGLPDPNHYTTASDLSKIALAFIQNQQLLNYAKTKDSKVTWMDYKGRTHSTIIHNTNQLLGIYPGNQGLKTGTTQEAGQCLVSYTTGPDGDLLLVLLGSQQRYTDAVKLIDLGYAGLRTQAALMRSAADPISMMNSPGFIP